MIFLLSTAVAGGWTQPEGALYAKAGYRAVMGTGGFGAGGDVVELDESYLDQLVVVYGEYGLTDSWTLVVNAAPIGHARYGDQSTLYTGPDRVGVRRAITTGAMRTAVEVRYGFTPGLGAVNLAGGDVDFTPGVPGHVVEGEVQLGYGWGPNWVTASVGGRGHTALSPAMLAGLQVGRQWEHLVLDLHLPATLVLGELNGWNYMGTGDTNYVGMGVGIGWWFNDTIGLSTAFEAVAFAEANRAAPTIPLYIQVRR